MSRSQTIVIFVILAMFVTLVLILVGVLPGRKTAQPLSATIEVWGVGDAPDIWKDVIAAFNKDNPLITVVYKRFDADTYEEHLIDSLAEGKGPDVFFLKNSWITKHQDKIAPFPQASFSFTTVNFARTFADIASQDLIINNQILGFPLYIDTPALFYNKDIFNAAAIAQTPQNWDDVVRYSQKLTQTTAGGDVTKSGIALGTSNNIEYAFEILNTLIMQTGDPIIDRRTKTLGFGQGANGAAAFYTSFSDPKSKNFSWTPREKNALDAFAEGNTAMTIGFSRDLSSLAQKNSHLSFSVLPFPQQKNAQTPVVFGEYYFPTVWKFSKNPTAAWSFILYITTQGTKPYLDRTGLPPARRDLIAPGAPNGDLDIFYRQALIAKDWPIPDEGVVSRLFSDAIDSIVTRTVDMGQAVNKLRDQLRLFTQQ